MKKNKCSKCGYEWVARVEKPVACPSCKQYQTEVPRTVEKELPTCEYCENRGQKFIENDSVYVCERCFSEINTYICRKCGLIFRKTEENFIICENCEA